MKKILLGSLLCLFPFLGAMAQSQVKYGYVSYDSLFHAMPEYAEAQVALADLRGKYETEASYNEMAFKRMFTEFLAGQKDFPQNILLKRQRDLQEAMEKSLAYRHAADSLLDEAAGELFRPVRTRLDSTLRVVGLERGYECIVNTDTHTHLFFSPGTAEDATPFVIEKLQALKP